MPLPSSIKSSLSKHLAPITSESPLTGGDINQAVKISTTNNTYFIKYHPKPYPHMYESESLGLQLLSQKSPLIIPQPVVVTSKYLVLEWLDLDPHLKQKSRIQQSLGTALARLHQHTSKHYGLDHDNYIGSLSQSNQPSNSWPNFYYQKRLLPQLKLLKSNPHLPSSQIKSLITKLKLLQPLLSILLPSHPQSSLLHGDLWSGNWSPLKSGQIALFDPAVYFGHREVDIAMTRLFGGFTNDFYQAYNSVLPLDSGYLDRQPLYQLYPLFVHTNLFGSPYSSRVIQILDRLLSTHDL